MTSSKQWPCRRCYHSADWHRLNDSENVAPTDPAAEFRCIGYDCTVDGPMPHDGESWCDCPDYLPGDALTPTAEQMKRKPILRGGLPRGRLNPTFRSMMSATDTEDNR